MEKREFRKAPSLAAERVSRGLIAGFLSSRGYLVTEDAQKMVGAAITQTVYATSPGGQPLGIRVKLCWRRISKHETYAASQLISEVKDNAWVETVQGYAARAMKKGITHFLFVQPEEDLVTLAALIPATELVSVWCKQRDASIKAGKSANANHAMNGRSPTIWLATQNYPEVPVALWQHKGVIDLVKLPVIAVHSSNSLSNSEDMFNDLPGVDLSLLGSDGTAKVILLYSGYKRDQKVRKAVLKRAIGKCERCAESRSFTGFLDVHHILGIGTSDRVYNCVALCPNCHREAHFAPDHDNINTSLLKAAEQFKQSGKDATNDFATGQER